MLINCGIVHLLSKWNVGIYCLPVCLCNELDDGKEEMNLEWTNQQMLAFKTENPKHYYLHYVPFIKFMQNQL